MIKQTAIRVPTDLATEIDFVARVRQTSTNSLIIEAVRKFLAQVATDPEFAKQAQAIMADERELLRKLLDEDFK